MLVLGVDPGQLRASSGAFIGAAQRLEALLATLGEHAAQLSWVGADAEAFRAELTRVCQQGTEVALRVHARGLQLETEADEQDTASSADSGSVEKLPYRFDGQSLPGFGPHPATPEGGGPNPVEVLDPALDLMRQLGLGRLESHLEDVLGPVARRVLKFLPIIGAFPDAIEAGQALGEGDTGDAIGNTYEFVLGIVPHPIAAGISAGNDIGDLILPGDSSPIEHLGELATYGDGTRTGEMIGGRLSDHLGYEEGSVVDNVLTSGGGLVGHFTSLTGHRELPSVARNWIDEETNWFEENWFEENWLTARP